MKKTFKSALSFALALILAFGSVSVFAADETDILEWDYYGDFYSYTYEGELSSDTVTLKTDKPNIYYTFNCDEPGFYSFSYSDKNEVWVGIPDRIEDGVAYDEADYISMYPESEYITIYYIPAGENILGLDIFEVGENNEIKIEYLGESLSSIDIENEIIFDNRLEFYENDDGSFSANLNTDHKLVFSNGKTIETYYSYFDSNEKPVNGENNLEIEFLGQKSVLNVTGYYPDYFIKDISVSNSKKFASVVKYYDRIDFLKSEKETVTVTLSDGTTQSFVYGDDSHIITLPNGEECWIEGWFHWDSDDKIVFVFGIGNTVLKTYPCEVKNASPDENFEKLLENNEYSLENASYYFRESLISLLECDSNDELFDYGCSNARQYLKEAITSFFSIFTNIIELIKFYIR